MVSISVARYGFNKTFTTFLTLFLKKLQPHHDDTAARSICLQAKGYSPNLYSVGDFTPGI